MSLALSRGLDILIAARADEDEKGEWPKGPDPGGPVLIPKRAFRLISASRLSLNDLGVAGSLS